MDVLISGRPLKENPGLKIAVEELMQSQPPETQSYCELNSEEEFIDFCETHPVPKKLEIYYRELKKALVKRVMEEVKQIKRTITATKVKSVITARPNPLKLEIDKTLLAQNLGLDEWFHQEKVELTSKLNIYIDNSSSITFSRRLDLARSLAILLMSYKKLPELNIFFFAESVHELKWKKESVEDFVNQYLSIKGSGYTDLSKALRHLQNRYSAGHREKTLFISDGVSSVGSKQVDLKLPLGKIHYLKLSGRTTSTSEELTKIIKRNKGKTVIIKPNGSLVKPLYQVIKRL